MSSCHSSNYTCEVLNDNFDSNSFSFLFQNTRQHSVRVHFTLNYHQLIKLHYKNKQKIHDTEIRDYPGQGYHSIFTGVKVCHKN